MIAKNYCGVSGAKEPLKHTMLTYNITNSTQKSIKIARCACCGFPSFDRVIRFATLFFRMNVCVCSRE